MKTYTICGSMRYEKEMKKIAYQLETQKGYNVLQCTYSMDNIIPKQDEINCIESAHYLKIDLSDGIYVVNIDSYIGTSVQKEIAYAKERGKEIIYHCVNEGENNG